MISKYGIFCKVVENRSFTKTAEEIGYSQSAVSQSIKALEQELGRSLFHRRKSGLTLTREGKELASYIQSVFTAEQALQRKQKELDGLVNSVIHIAEVTTVNRRLLPLLIKEFQQLHPQVSFSFHHGFYSDVEQWVLSGTADLGFVDSQEAPLLHHQPLFYDELLAVMPKGHPLTSQKEVSLRDLTEYPFILLYDERAHHNEFLREFHNRGLTPEIAYHVPDDDSILTMVELNMGVSSVYQLFLYSTPVNLATRPIKEHPGRTLSLVWSNWETMPVSAKVFAKFVKNRTPSLLEEIKRDFEKRQTSSL